MFDFFRQHMKIFMWALFILVIPSFVLFGIEGYTKFNQGSQKVATLGQRKPVNGRLRCH